MAYNVKAKRRASAMCEANAQPQLAEVRAWIEKNKYKHGPFELEFVNADDLIEFLSEHFG